MKGRRLISCLLIVFLVMGSVFVPGEVSAQPGENVKQEDFIDLGTPIQTAQTIDAAYGVENGVNVVYTTITGSQSEGVYAKFNVIDLDNQKLLNSYTLDGATNAWNHIITPDGRVFIGASNKVFVYSPVTKDVRDLGIPMEGSDSIWSLTSDEEGNVYGGIYSVPLGGRIFKVDATNLEITDLLGEPVDANEEYIRSIVYYDGYLYAGTGATNGRVWKINLETKEKERLELPGTPDDPIYQGRYNPTGFTYGITVVDHYLFAFFNGPSIILVYDLEAQEWRDEGLSNIRGLLAVTGEHNGKVYTSKKDGFMWEIDVETLEEQRVMPFNTSIRESKWIDVDNQPEFDGPAMVTITYDGKIALYDPATNKEVYLSGLVDGQPIDIQSIEAGPDEKVYISSYMGSQGATFDPANNDKLDNFALEQVEGFGVVEDTMYFGVYPKARIFAWNTTKPMPIQGPDLLLNIENEQDRPFALAEGDGKLLIGTIPDYAKYGGALTIYDPHESAESGTSVYEVHRNIVENQSITGLAYKDGIVYGSTSIYGGLGADPIAERAKLFAWDMETKSKIHEWELDLEGLSETVPIISGLTVGRDGFIWGVADGFVFAFDPVTYEIVKSKHVYPEVKDFGRWRPIKIYFGSDNLLYTNVGDKLTVINPETMESKLIKEKVALFTLTHKNDIYFAQGAKVFKKLAEEPTNLTLNGPELLSIGNPQDLHVTAEFYGWSVDVTDQTTFVSSDPEIAKIENGVIIPKQAGKVTISASYMGLTIQSLEVIINKVQNGSFEIVNGTELLGWSLLKGKERNTGFSSTEMSYSGARSLKLIDSYTKGRAEIQSDFIQIEAGKDYEASAKIYIRTKNKENIKVKNTSLLEIQFFDENGDQLPGIDLGSNDVEVPLEEWFSVKVNGTAPENAKFARLVLKGYFGWIEEEYYDDVLLLPRNSSN